MTQTTVANLDSFYEQVQERGYLLTRENAEQWSWAILRSLGHNLPRGTRKDLAKALPEELGNALTRKFWLLHFRDKNKSANQFLKEIARMSGNTDGAFARLPTLAVFHELKSMAGPDLSDEVAEALAPELSALWQQA
jgi:uncharacterized protein (DUF2267 family)